MTSSQCCVCRRPALDGKLEKRGFSETAIYGRTFMLTVIQTKLFSRVDHGEEDTLIRSMIDAAAAASTDYLHISVAM